MKNLKLPKEGSKWTAYDGNVFRVINTTEVGGKIWVYYISEDLSLSTREYSCYVESFLSRFNELPK